MLSANTFGVKESTLNWLIYNLLESKVIHRVSRNAYVVNGSAAKMSEYEFFYSDETSAVLRFLSDRFPLLDFIVWETRTYNDFANHQLARNFIFVEVEKPLEESPFEALREKFTLPVLFKPNAKEIALYSDETTVAVIALTSEAPIRGHETTLEKILVDLYANPLIDFIVSKGDYDGIFDEAFDKYILNKKTMQRYAKRRGKAESVAEMIEKHAVKKTAGSK
jgi:hypothetical protein